jgi:hypothetical protein
MLRSKRPEYKSWSLEKIQQEYFSLKLKYTAKRLNDLDAMTKAEKLDELVRLLKELLGDEC